MSVQQWAERELKHSKTNQSDVIWGKKVITSIDLDDCVRLGILFNQRKHPNSNINLQTTSSGYDGYLWTVSIHKFLGDTVVHYALKQSKLYCIYMLLLLGADLSIPNARGEIPSEMIQQIYQTSPENMRYDAKRRILNHIKITDFNKLPSSIFHCDKIEEESWKLINSGRLLYNEVPKVMQTPLVGKDMSSRVTMTSRKHLSFNHQSNIAKIIENQSFLPSNENGSKEENSRFDVDNVSDILSFGKTRKVKKRCDWMKLQSDDGYVYYVHKVSQL
jgi:hypothetical protein